MLITNIYSSNSRYFNDSSRHFEMDDPFTENLDVVAVNKYMGWNRKGLVSDQGYRKQAWYIMHEYYMQLKTNKSREGK